MLQKIGRSESRENMIAQVKSHSRRFEHSYEQNNRLKELVARRGKDFFIIWAYMFCFKNKFSLILLSEEKIILRKKSKEFEMSRAAEHAEENKVIPSTTLVKNQKNRR